MLARRRAERAHELRLQRAASTCRASLRSERRARMERRREARALAPSTHTLTLPLILTRASTLDFQGAGLET